MSVAPAPSHAIEARRASARGAALVALASLAAACAVGDGVHSGDAGDAGDGGRRRDGALYDAGMDALAGPRCTRSSECTADPRAPVCDTARGRCVACTPADDRCDPADHCDPGSNTCAPGCRSDMGCALPAARCNTTLHACVECTAGEHCPIGTSCAGGRCTPGSCPAGMADCNRSMADGCEANLAMDPNNCGACGARPAEACNGLDDNCNGRCDDLDGCRVGVHRSLGVEHFYTTNRDEAACCGFRVEAENFFYLYTSAVPGTVPFLRCYDAGRGRHTYTTRSDCEGRGRVEGTLGYIGTSGACGGTPLYRLYRAANDDSFYTVSAAERDHAVSLGYTALELSGYVWTGPRG